MCLCGCLLLIPHQQIEVRGIVGCLGKQINHSSHKFRRTLDLTLRVLALTFFIGSVDRKWALTHSVWLFISRKTVFLQTSETWIFADTVVNKSLKTELMYMFKGWLISSILFEESVNISKLFWSCLRKYYRCDTSWQKVLQS